MNVYKVVGFQITFSPECLDWLNIREREIITLFVVINLDIHLFHKVGMKGLSKIFHSRWFGFNLIKDIFSRERLDGNCTRWNTDTLYRFYNSWNLLVLENKAVLASGLWLWNLNVCVFISISLCSILFVKDGLKNSVRFWKHLLVMYCKPTH